MLTDGRWAVLEPLIEACRPKGKTPPQDLRRTIGAILRRRRIVAKRRAVPSELRVWRRAAQTVVRWARLGARERLSSLVQEHGVKLGMAFLNGGGVRVSQKAAGDGAKGGSSAQRDKREAFGRSRGGYGTKACVIADGAGRAVAFRLAPGQAHELPQAVPLLANLPGAPKWVVADRGHTSHAFREHVWNMGARPAIPPRRDEAPVACPE